jgi:glucosamine-6-phosphate isomerase
MNISYFDTYDELSQKAADIIASDLKVKKNLFFCAATGGSPTGMYAQMAKVKKSEPTLFDQMQVMKMDEWGIIPSSHPDTCESYLQKHLLAPLSIPQDRYLTFDPNISNLSAECARVEQEMEAIGPIDICILGLGKNGHIAFNEPADYLQRGFHKAILAPSTTQHDPTLNEGKEPAFGLCLGMSGIMQSKRIIFLVTGKGKQEAIKMILERKITTQWPASFLWMHGNVDCLIDRNSL